MIEQLEKPLRTAIHFLEKQGYRYAIIGGIALSQWGVIRATYDVDLKVLVPDSDYSAVRSNLLTAFPNPGRSHVPHNPLIVAVTIDEIIVDFLLAIPGYEELIVERAVQKDLGGWAAWVCSAEDLIIRKAVADRAKDWLDIEALLLEQRKQLDEPYIQNWLEQFAELLEKPEVFTRYQQLLAKSKAVS